MSTPEDTHELTTILTEEAIATAVRHMAREIVDAHASMDSVVLLGILTRGRPLADRIAVEINAILGESPRVGSLATTLYRDDLRAGQGIAKMGTGKTHFDFDVNDQTVIIVDDVFAAGRTARAAMDEVMDYGRPARIQLACLIDRGVHELPIRPDFLGWSIATTPVDHVRVRLQELDGEEGVWLKETVPQD